MKRLWTFLTILWSLSFLFSCSIESERTAWPVTLIEEETNGEYVEGEVIVTIDESVACGDIDVLVPGNRVKTVTPKGSSQRMLLYRLFDRDECDTVIIALMSSGLVNYAEKNAVYSLCEYVPDDPYYSTCQYSPQITGCEEAWEAVQSPGGGIIVAVLDTGINGEHEELEGRVIAGRNVLTGEDIPEGTNSDDNGHGSHVAGIIGAKGDNGKGIAGVAWDCSLMPVKIFGNDIQTTTAHIAEAIVWAVDHGARVISMSFVGMLYSMAVNDAVNYALNRDVVLVAAMGNDGRAKIEYPGAHPGVIAVGATNGRDQVAYFSTRGNHISVAAPGESIYSLKNTSNTEYVFGSGTSMATPFVTGVAALLLSARPELTPVELRSIIEDSAVPLGPDEFSPAYGYGRVSVYNALNLDARNNYGTVTVNVTNRDEPVGGIKVLLEDTADNTIVQAGITSYGGIEGVLNGQIVFNHIHPGDYRVRVQAGIHKETFISITPKSREQTASFAFDTPMVLVVNAIKVADASLLTAEALYAERLTSMGKAFTLWKTAYHGPPPKSLIDAYDLLIWFTGNTQNNPSKQIEILTEYEITLLEEYCDKGGRLYLSGNNIAQHLKRFDPDFLAGYLHAEYLTSPLSHDELLGRGLLDGMDFFISMADDDQIDILDGATGILDSSDEPDENHWAGLSWDSGYRLIFTTPYPNQINSSFHEEFFNRVLTWLESDG
ncbi:MAG: peptidase S8 [Spirochaetales bacterium]|nr:peptidase S8 [Spirochaetales bacterium]